MKRKSILFLTTMILTICALTGCQSTASSNETETSSSNSNLVETIPISNESSISDTAAYDSTTTDSSLSSTETSAVSSVGSAADCYQSVLKNEMTFVDTNNNNTPSYLNDVHYSDDVTCTPKQYAMVDFDGDGEKEVCVEMDLGFDGEFIVLHYFDGTVYGYSFPYRGMELLSENGCYIGSSGAANNYIFSMSFHDADYVEKTVAYSDLDDNAVAVYFNENGEPITEAEFNALFNSIQAAPASWITF